MTSWRGVQQPINDAGYMVANRIKPVLASPGASIYESAGSWTDDDVDEATFKAFTSAPPEGKVRGSDPHGNPAWVDIPPLTHEQQVAIADNQKSALLTQAQSTISLWQTKSQLGTISDADKSSLITWIAYIKEVQSVDTSTAPDIVWPVGLEV